jgi:hypothetical protein
VSRLHAAQPDAVVLCFHVDYWDYLGWPDPFASKAASERQRRYAAAHKWTSVYTPQLVIDGSRHIVGSREAQVKAAAVEEAHYQVPLDIAAAAERSSGQLTVTLATPGVAKTAAVALVALVQDGLQVKVLRGENAGSTLRHDCVVRAFQEVAIAAQQPQLQQQVTLSVPTVNFNRAAASLVAVLQDPVSMRVLAVTRQPLSRFLA